MAETNITSTLSSTMTEVVKLIKQEFNLEHEPRVIYHDDIGSIVDLTGGHVNFYKHSTINNCGKTIPVHYFQIYGVLTFSKYVGLEETDEGIVYFFDKKGQHLLGFEVHKDWDHSTHTGEVYTFICLAARPNGQHGRIWSITSLDSWDDLHKAFGNVSGDDEFDMTKPIFRAKMKMVKKYIFN